MSGTLDVAEECGEVGERPVVQLTVRAVLASGGKVVVGSGLVVPDDDGGIALDAYPGAFGTVVGWEVTVVPAPDYTATDVEFFVQETFVPQPESSMSLDLEPIVAGCAV